MNQVTSLIALLTSGKNPLGGGKHRQLLAPPGPDAESAAPTGSQAAPTPLALARGPHLTVLPWRHTRVTSPGSTSEQN